MYKNVMWATDGSEAADRALPHAKALVVDGGGKLTVVYCEEFTLPGKGAGRLPIYANEDEIAAKDHADVIVVGTRGRTPLAGLVLGGVTQRLLHIPPCPVLAVPPDRGSSE